MLKHHKQIALTDCGQACIKTLLSYYDIFADDSKFQCEDTTQGMSLYEIEKNLYHYGVVSESYQIDDFNYLLDIDVPYIMVIDRNGFPHYVVVCGFKDGFFDISDPSLEGFTKIFFDELISKSMKIILIPKDIKLDNIEQEKDIDKNASEAMYLLFEEFLSFRQKMIILFLGTLRIFLPVATAIYLQYIMLSSLDTKLSEKIFQIGLVLIFLVLYWLSSVLENNIKLDIENDFLSRVLYKYFQKTLNDYNVSTDYEYISSYFWNLLLSATGIAQKYYLRLYVLLFILLMTVLAYFNFLFFIITLVTIIFFYIYGKIQVRTIAVNHREFIANSSNFSSFIEMSISGLFDIHAYQKEDIFLTEFQNRIQKMIATKKIGGVITNKFFSSIQIFIGITAILVFLVLQLLPFEQSIFYSSNGILLILLLSTVLTPMMTSWITLKKSEYSFEFIQNSSRGNTGTSKNIIGVKKIDNIELKDITKIWKDKPLFEGLNYTFKSGEMTVITGQNGSGKSTLVRILQGLVTPDLGNVTINGNKIYDNLMNTDILNYISIYSSEFQVFPGSVANNISFDVFSSKTTDEEDFLRLNLSPFYQISMGGYNISQGQKQKILLSRALKDNKDIYILDEPSGNLDVESIKLLMDRIQKLVKQNKIVIIITHNDYIISCANNIFEIG